MAQSNTILIDAEADKLAVWTLVLDAEGIPYRVVRRPDGWSVAVRASDGERSLRALADYERENATIEPADSSVDFGAPGSILGVWIAALLVLFYVFSGPVDSSSAWHARGTASSGAIAQGEVWLTVTALTLHADVTHILSNALGLALFASALGRAVGPGVALWLMLWAGAIGNYLNAIAHPPGYRSIGASTAVFGAVGLLAGLQLARQRRLGAPRGRALSALAAGVALLAILGTGPATGVMAHMLGFLAGGVLGALTGVGVRKPPARKTQWVLAVTAVGAVAASWVLAWRP